MKTLPADFAKDRVMGGLWGSLIGDALGVPVEFRDREELVQYPVTGMREYGTHHQPKGTWSDDGALILCTVDSLVNAEFDTQDIGRRFVRWMNEELWTATGVVFDIGMITTSALMRIAILSDDFLSMPAEEIISTGYVMHALHASVWCLLNTENYRDCVLSAVNLGGDTDTAGCVAGGLAGAFYGMKNIPPEWLNQLPKKGDLDCLFHEFAEMCSERTPPRQASNKPQ
jgi:ADP-ribosylglycohydrolase